MEENKTKEEIQQELKKIDKKINAAYNGGASEQVIDILQTHREQKQMQLDDLLILEKNNERPKISTDDNIEQ